MDPDPFQTEVAQVALSAAGAHGSITAEEIAESVRRLDRLDDSVFQSLYGLNALEVGQLRAAFADWPRS